MSVKEKTARKKISILLRDIGHYHHARFQALSDVFDVTVIETRTNNGEYHWNKSYINDRNYKLIEWNNKNLFHLITNSRKALRNSNPSFIFTHGWADKEYLVVLLWAKLLRIPIVSGCDSTIEDTERSVIKEKLKSICIVKRFDGFLSAGKRTDRYLHRLGIRKNIFRPYDVVDNEYFNTKTTEYRNHLSIKEHLYLPEKYILSLGRFVPKKNIITLIEAYSEVLKKQPAYPYQLVLVGSGTEEISIKKRITALALENRVSIHDFVQYHDLPKFYAYASAFIIASTSDQWGLVVNEAMASKLPVFVSESCGCADDLVQHSVNGLCFSPIQEAIEDTLIQIGLLPEETLANMGEQGSKLVQTYSIGEYVLAFKRILATLTRK